MLACSLHPDRCWLTPSTQTDACMLTPPRHPASPRLLRRGALQVEQSVLPGRERRAGRVEERVWGSGGQSPGPLSAGCREAAAAPATPPANCPSPGQTLAAAPVPPPPYSFPPPAPPPGDSESGSVTWLATLAQSRTGRKVCVLCVTPTSV